MTESEPKIRCVRYAQGSTYDQTLDAQPEQRGAA
jgi:hypothetical protein